MNKLLILIFLVSCASSSRKDVVEMTEIEKRFQKSVKSIKGEKDALYLKGLAQAHASDAQGALEQFSLLYKQDASSMVEKKLALSLVRAGKLEESLPYLIRLGASASADSKINLVLAGVYSGLKKDDLAVKVYKNILVKDPGNESACIFLAKRLATKQSYKVALKGLEKCAAENPRKGIFHYYIGKIQVDRKNFRQAISAFKKSIEKQAEFGESALGVGLVLEHLGEKEEALKFYKDYLKDFSTHEGILERVVAMEFERSNFAQVLPYLELLTDLDPDNLNLKVKLAILYTDLKKYEAAKNQFKSLLQVAPDNDKLIYYLASVYKEVKEYENAIEQFTLISADSGLYDDSAMQVAGMLKQLALNNPSREKEFLSYLDEVEEELKSSVAFAVMKSSYFEQTNRKNRAIASLKTVSHMDDFKGEHTLYLASMLEELGKYEEAFEAVQELLDQEPKNADALNFLGYSLVERELNLDQAYQYLVKALEVRPGDPYIVDSLGWYYYKIGKIELAQEQVEIAYKKLPEDFSVQKHLGIIYAKTGNIEQSRKFLDLAKAQATNKVEISKIEELVKQLPLTRLPASN